MLEKERITSLRKMAKEANIEGYKDMTREELIANLDNPKVEEKEEEVEEKKEEVVVRVVDDEVKEKEEEVVVRVVNDIGVKEEHVPIGSKAEAMKKELSLQPKVRILIPRGQNERMGTTQSVILNGYRLNIMKGVYVNVPKQIADIIMEENNQTIAAIEAEGMRRTDGGPIKLDDNPSSLS